MGQVVKAALGTAALAIALGGCNQPRWDNPLDAYQSIVRLLHKGETKEAWTALSQQSRKILEERAREIAQASGGAITPDARALFFSSTVQPRAIKELKLVSQDGDVALLSVTPDEGPPRQVRMVKEAGGWKLDVSEMLED